MPHIAKRPQNYLGNSRGSVKPLAPRSVCPLSASGSWRGQGYSPSGLCETDSLNAASALRIVAAIMVVIPSKLPRYI